MHPEQSKPSKRYRSCTSPFFRLVAALTFLSLAGASPLAAGDFPAVVTEGNLRTVILEQGGSFSDAERGAMDINGDDRVDVADLVLYVSTLAARPSGVNLSCAVSTVVEGGGDVTIDIILPVDYQGSIYLAASGTTDSSDFTMTPSGAVSMDGSSGQLTLTFPDDRILEGTEVLTITLLADPGYQIGTGQQHTIYIRDNDSSWEGLLETALAPSRTFTLELIRDGKIMQATWISDGSQTIPEGRYEYPVGDSAPFIRADGNGFELQTGPFPAYESPLGGQLQRKITLSVNPENPEHILEYDSRIQGMLTETITIPGAEQFNRDIEGTFILLKRIDPLNVPQSVLINSPE